MKKTRLFTFLIFTILCPALIYARDDGGPQYKAPPEIVAALPKICWWLYMDNVPNTPEFNIKDCGAYSNHYCPGIVNMKQAEREKTTAEKWAQLQAAKNHMEYTLKFTEHFPECSVRMPAKMNLERIKFQMDMVKLNARKR